VWQFPVVELAVGWPVIETNVRWVVQRWTYTPLTQGCSPIEEGLYRDHCKKGGKSVANVVSS
jgi:hypothetical protein